MVITTTSNIEGHKILEYLGIVTGESAVLTGDYESLLWSNKNSETDAFVDVRDRAFAMLKSRAEELGANAIIGVSLDLEEVGGRVRTLMVCASGTAVRIELST